MLPTARWSGPVSLFPTRPFACCLTQTRCDPTFVITAVAMLDWPLRAWLGWWTRSWAGLVQKKWPRRYSSKCYNNWKKRLPDKCVFLRGVDVLLFFSLYVSLCLSHCLSLCFFLSVSLCLFLCLSVCLSECLYVCLHPCSVFPSSSSCRSIRATSRHCTICCISTMSVLELGILFPLGEGNCH